MVQILHRYKSRTTAAISPPRRVRITDVKDSSITLTWRSKVETISGFLIDATPTSNSHEPIQRTISPDLRSYTLTGLQPGTIYTIHFYTLNGEARSAPFTLTTSTIKPSVEGPTNIRFTSLTPNAISFTWDAPRTRITGYFITYEESGGSPRELTPRPHAGMNYATISGLKPGTEYIIKIITLLGAQRSSPLVGKARTPISPPRRVRITDVKDSSITLTWRSKVETISGFLIDATPTSSSHEPIRRTISPDLRSYTLTGLQPGTIYTILFYTLNGEARSAPFTLTTSTIKPSVEGPTNIRFTSLTPNAISFTWDAPRTRITGYFITYEESGGSPRELTPRPHAGMNYATISGLKPGTEYIIKIITLLGAQRSSPLVGKARTQPEPLLPVLPALPVPHRPGPDILDVPETDLDQNRVQLVGTNGHDMLGQQGQHIYTEYQSQGNGPQITFTELGPDRELVPLVRVGDGPVLAYPFGFPENETGMPQESQTQTTVSWQPYQQSSEYLLSCQPVTQQNEKLFQMRLPGTSTSATLVGLTSGASYNVIVEAIKEGLKRKILEEMITVSNTVPGNVPSKDVCYDTFTATYHDVGDEWERMSDTGFKLWCKCLGLGSGHFRCDSSKWCHDNGQNYRIDEKWDRKAENGHMMSCTCLGNGKGEFKCEPHEATCYDNGKVYQVGNQWQKEYLGAICTCTCHGGQQGWRCENCRRPGADLDVDLVQPVHTDLYDRYRENTLRKLNIQCPIECLRPELLADAQNPRE
ncbi:fibronectin-like [Conger conger]|uniref:fibronectin-like n=1 Tax=Conger conger TaxID=82655 RepID=UPI002A5AF120|nr:fibronectin-like [Conger conger]